MATIYNNCSQSLQTGYTPLLSSIIFDVSLVAIGVITILALTHYCPLYFVAIPSAICITALISVVVSRVREKTVQVTNSAVINPIINKKEPLIASKETLPPLPSFELTEEIVLKLISKTDLGKYYSETKFASTLKDLEALLRKFHNSLSEYFLGNETLDGPFSLKKGVHGFIQLSFNHDLEPASKESSLRITALYLLLKGYAYTYFNKFIIADYNGRSLTDKGGSVYLVPADQEPIKNSGFEGPFYPNP